MKVLFITGGVLSGIGKGIAAASIGALIKWTGKKVFCQKFDGYLNVDPGTMSPFQHGEVFVTNDWTETDLDIGHYERFLDTDMNRFSSFTTGNYMKRLFPRKDVAITLEERYKLFLISQISSKKKFNSGMNRLEQIYQLSKLEGQSVIWKMNTFSNLLDNFAMNLAKKMSGLFM